VDDEQKKGPFLFIIYTSAFIIVFCPLLQPDRIARVSLPVVDVSAPAILAVIHVVAALAARQFGSLSHTVARNANLQQVRNHMVGIRAPAFQGGALFPKAGQIIFTSHSLPRKLVASGW
jgi:hypothetical protein